MNWPPMLVHVKIQNKNHHFGFWVPLFLVGLIPLVFLIALSPLILLAILICWPSGWGKRILLGLKTVYEMLCSLRGTKVDIQGRNEVIFVSIV
ncbi:MAG: hypothetical protein ACYDG5_07290 [Dehalococcoidales bacterium]